MQGKAEDACDIRQSAEMAIFEYINDRVDVPPGGIAMCQNESCLNCPEKGEDSWKYLE